MFGQDDQTNQQQDNNQIPDQSIDAAMAADSGLSAPVDGQALDTPPVQPTVAANDQAWQHPGAPLGDSPTSAPQAPSPAPTTVSEPDAAAPLGDDLIDIKQQALAQLSPLVGHLEQGPEDKFRTTMMMIQASDDQSLIKTAYQAAQSITDEKVRAQALLDVVNEINYFTQQHED